MKKINTDIKILAVEDDEFMKMFLKDVFLVHGKNSGKRDFDLVLKETTDDARKYLENNVPEVVMLDLALPKRLGDRPMSDEGFGVLSMMRSDKRFVNTKILVFSGYNDSELKEKAMQLGATRYFVKGEYLPKDLIEAVRNS